MLWQVVKPRQSFKNMQRGLWLAFHQGSVKYSWSSHKAIPEKYILKWQKKMSRKSFLLISKNQKRNMASKLCQIKEGIKSKLGEKESNHLDLWFGRYHWSKLGQ